jgi:hypothetical protein
MTGALKKQAWKYQKQDIGPLQAFVSLQLLSDGVVSD